MSKLMVLVTVASAFVFEGKIRTPGTELELPNKFAAEMLQRGKVELAGDADEDDLVDLNDLTVPELKKLAADEGLEGYQTMKKDQLISALATLLSEPEDGEGLGDDAGDSSAAAKDAGATQA